VGRLHSLREKSADEKKGLLCIFLAIFTLISSENSIYADDVNNIIVGVYKNPPKINVSYTGEPEGIFIDILQAIAKKNRWNLIYVYGSWNELLDKLERGIIDILPDVAYSHERENFLDFMHIPVLLSWIQVAVKPGTIYNDLKDLEGKKLAVLKGSIQEELCKDIQTKLGVSIELLSYGTYDDLISAVDNGDADGAVVSRFYGYTQNNKKLAITPIIIETTTLHFAVKKNTNKELLTVIDGELTRMFNDPRSEYYKSLSWWLHEKPIYYFPRYLIILILIVVALMIAFLLFSLLLKQQVNRKTSALLNANNNLNEALALVKNTESALDKNKIYLYELLHRSRNNMAVISSLLYINAWNTKNDAVLQYAENIDAHIAIMSLVFGLVENSEDFSSIRISEFINGFIDLFVQHNTKRKFYLTCPHIIEDKLLFDIALPLGFVLYEMIISMINFPKKTFNEEYLRIEIEYKKISNEVGLFTITCCGGGNKLESKDFFNGDRMKLIIDLLEKQLIGKASIINGTTVQIEFALIRYSLRV